jgi:RND family efflux transporter MFP subunit
MSPETQTSASEPKRRRGGGFLTFLFLLILLGGAGYVAFFGITSRHEAYAKLTTKTNERSVPTVKAALPGTQPNTQSLDLPGRLEAYTRAALFARVNGYLASWKADIGTHVKAGDLLAEIEAPDLDQQLSQALSDLTNAEANAQLAEVTNQRYQALLPSSAISRQTADEKASDYAAKVALVKSAEANVQRLRALSEFKRITAPFDGIVTARNTDVGALINSGSASGSELFVVSDTHKLRLYVNVPQNYVPAVKISTVARLTVPERPGKFYDAKVESTSGAIDVASGASRVQLGIDNSNGELLPGAYASVHFEIANALQVLTVPSSAVIFDKGGLRVATVDADNRVTLKSIKVARDLGNVIEISAGLDAADRVIDSPPDDLIDGDRVKIKAAPDSVAPPSASLVKPDIKG